MEAVMMNSIGDNKHRIRNPKRNFVTNRTLFPYPSDNLLFSSFLAGGHFTGGSYLSMPPPTLSRPYPPGVPVFRPPQNLHQFRQQPPLLPLPISTPPINHQNLNITRSNSTSNNNFRLSPPQINKNIKNRVRDHSLTPKKSKNQKKDSKKEVPDPIPPSTAEEKQPPPAEEKCSPESSINEVIEPDLKDLDLPQEIVISRVFSSSINKSCDTVSIDVDEFSGSSVFAPSPPPSSLPLPTFSLRSKVGCKAEVSGVDAGATDSLRRLLRL